MSSRTLDESDKEKMLWAIEIIEKGIIQLREVIFLDGAPPTYETTKSVASIDPPATEKQLKYLTNLGVPSFRGTRTQASALIQKLSGGRK